MTDRNRQTVNIVAQISLAVSVIGLTLTIAVGIWRLGAMYGAVSNEHQQLFQIIKEKCK